MMEPKIFLFINLRSNLRGFVRCMKVRKLSLW
ncbi:hypothetical protein MTR67_011449 [Solanum verrucosum]|uniref:Uncharacterized protein n=1 Tax=Solanum verrucosum TaxID=315347 RepID=A0AAF0QDS5_SOLVR|nr:hypothetical protein MTR67_011449 [Solanum verrucosum]